MSLREHLNKLLLLNTFVLLTYVLEPYHISLVFVENMPLAHVRK